MRKLGTLGLVGLNVAGWSALVCLFWPGWPQTITLAIGIVLLAIAIVRAQ